MNKYFLSVFIVLLCTVKMFSQTNQTFKIVQKPIIYDAERKALSVEYLLKRHGIKQSQATIVPKMIVLHFTGSGTLKSNFDYFNKAKIENARALNKDQSTLNVSSHYLVDRDGTVYQLMPDTFFARHTIGLNYMAIGIENVGGPNSPLTDAQVNANVALIKKLCAKHKIEYLIGHAEYNVFRNSSLWKETNKKYYTVKIDPGDDFMKKVRAQLKSYQLKQKP